MIASHYAEPLMRHIAEPASLLASPVADGEVLEQLAAGDPLDMLDCSLGWAWGYAGERRRVGYVRVEALRP